MTTVISAIATLEEQSRAETAMEIAKRVITMREKFASISVTQAELDKRLMAATSVDINDSDAVYNILRDTRDFSSENYMTYHRPR
jgi:hypothetical protein